MMDEEVINWHDIFLEDGTQMIDMLEEYKGLKTEKFCGLYIKFFSFNAEAINISNNIEVKENCNNKLVQDNENKNINVQYFTENKLEHNSVIKNVCNEEKKINKQQSIFARTQNFKTHKNLLIYKINSKSLLILNQSENSSLIIYEECEINDFFLFDISIQDEFCTQKREKTYIAIVYDDNTKIYTINSRLCFLFMVDFIFKNISGDPSCKETIFAEAIINGQRELIQMHFQTANTITYTSIISENEINSRYENRNTKKNSDIQYLKILNSPSEEHLDTKFEIIKVIHEKYDEENQNFNDSQFVNEKYEINYGSQLEEKIIRYEKKPEIFNSCKNKENDKKISDSERNIKEYKKYDIKNFELSEKNLESENLKISYLESTEAVSDKITSLWWLKDLINTPKINLKKQKTRKRNESLKKCQISIIQNIFFTIFSHMEIFFHSKEKIIDVYDTKKFIKGTRIFNMESFYIVLDEKIDESGKFMSTTFKLISKTDFNNILCKYTVSYINLKFLKIGNFLFCYNKKILFSIFVKDKKLQVIKYHLEDKIKSTNSQEIIITKSSTNLNIFLVKNLSNVKSTICSTLSVQKFISNPDILVSQNKDNSKHEISNMLSSENIDSSGKTYNTYNNEIFESDVKNSKNAAQSNEDTTSIYNSSDNLVSSYFGDDDKIYDLFYKDTEKNNEIIDPIESKKNFLSIDKLIKMLSASISKSDDKKNEYDENIGGVISAKENLSKDYVENKSHIISENLNEHNNQTNGEK
ncbi:hypothetical protein EDEG_03815 [Edhazardia aedis USNM 41457]|uniref:Uncharacterized protein n=1 Tax=Edhazardia aedis (strain USNM 41457) TaxID=1003232 RepID=J9DGB8_EDHAE|nr:hypothetical protein EDEG_03815 [Edhazardia aedis USNM 41457]|eukprot:EJW01640.2 hypothetical protein EDEG_03815 [Edhazardia aedis USNM 41457]